MTFIGIIPARYASTRFPGKPLALLGGKPVIQHVWERVSLVLDDCVVATDDTRILSAVEAFGGKAVMTGTHHKSGTDRCLEAYEKQGREFDVVVNIQGDEPFVHPEQVRTLCRLFAPQEASTIPIPTDIPNPSSTTSTDIATLAKPFVPEDGWQALENPNSPKVVVGSDMRALYFSRSVIPFLRGRERETWLASHRFLKHLGLYAYRTSTLREITSLPQSPLEKAESLEQLRWLENGYTIRVGLTDIETVGIDTPDDLRRAEQMLAATSI